MPERIAKVKVIHGSHAKDVPRTLIYNGLGGEVSERRWEAWRRNWFTTPALSRAGTGEGGGENLG